MPAPAGSHQPGLLSQAIVGSMGSAIILIFDKVFGVTRFEHTLYLYFCYVSWFVGSLIVYYAVRNPTVGRVVETLLVAGALLFGAWFIIRNKESYLEWLNSQEQARKDSVRVHLYRAIHQATLPYEDREIRNLFTDTTHSYDSVTIDLYDVHHAGIIDYEFRGQTLSYSPEVPLTFPFGANVELPFDREDYLLVEDLRGTQPRKLPTKIAAIPTAYHTYLYQASIPDFRGDLHYRRIFCHPGSQQFNPEAFLILTDLIANQIGDLRINLYSDSPLSNVLLQVPNAYDRSQGTYTWRDRELGEEEGPILDDEALKRAAAKAEAKWKWGTGTPGPLMFASGYSFHFVHPKRTRFFVIYFKGRNEARRFL